MIDTIDFYQAYPYDHHVYKILSLKQILERQENFANEYLNGAISGYNEKDFKLFLKREIRYTYFHVIETVFELMFALEPKENKLNDKQIFRRVCQSNWNENYKRIERIAQDKKELDFLDRPLTIYLANSNKVKLKCGEFIFYPGILLRKDKLGNEYYRHIPKSLENIKKCLHIFAQDFAEKHEYNSYKHVNRALSIFKEFSMYDPKTKKKLIEFDLNGSISYLRINKSSTELQLRTKVLDTDRDIKMTLLGTKLIANMIRQRGDFIAKPKERLEVEIYYLTDHQIEECSKRSTKVDDLTYTLNIENMP